MTHTALRRLLATVALFAAVVAGATAQSDVRFYRLHLHDKGTPRRILVAGDSLYDTAARLLSERALARRRKVLRADSIISTDDLPIHPPYLDAIRTTGAEVVQMSRWLNTVMVRCDSTTHAVVAALPFLDSVRTVRQFRRPVNDPIGKRPSLEGDTNQAGVDPAQLPWCMVDRYGSARRQNEFMGIDYAHRRGFAGEGVLVGILDAGFKWREHQALRNLDVVAERDFVYGDSNTADEPGEVAAQGHGTAVMSMIGGTFDGVLVGGAPHASFAIARTEDVRSELNVEEDNFVAGLEWLESLGVDVTNTSLGYTSFDAPELRHEYSELNGRTAYASRGLNHAVSLGVVCVVAAGNEGANSYRYVSVPAEADSAIAVAAVDSNGAVARFSSRGFGVAGGSGSPPRIKPDVAGLGVGNWGADHGTVDKLLTGQGTSFASPMVTATVALILSARPWLRPWEVREILYRTSGKPDFPDTAVGHGIVNISEAFQYMARTAPIVGMPRAYIRNDSLVLYWWNSYTLYTGKRDHGGDEILIVKVNSARFGLAAARGTTISPTGIATMVLPLGIGPVPAIGDSIDYDITYLDDGTYYSVRKGCLRIEENRTASHAPPYDRCTSTLCHTQWLPSIAVVTAVPNPTTGTTSISFQVTEPSTISLAVFNPLGEEVARLLENAQVEPGYHSHPWNPAGLPDGAYYYQLQVGGETYSDQVIVTRVGR